jgi:hypothetical protein
MSGTGLNPNPEIPWLKYGFPVSQAISTAIVDMLSSFPDSVFPY